MRGKEREREALIFGSSRRHLLLLLLLSEFSTWRKMRWGREKVKHGLPPSPPIASVRSNLLADGGFDFSARRSMPLRGSSDSLETVVVGVVLPLSLRTSFRPSYMMFVRSHGIPVSKIPSCPPGNGIRRSQNLSRQCSAARRAARLERASD